MANPKKIIKAVKSAKKAAERAKTNAIQKNSVKVKTKTGKTKRNPSDPAKTAYKFNNSYSRAEKRSIYKTGGGN